MDTRPRMSRVSAVAARVDRWGRALDGVIRQYFWFIATSVMILLAASQVLMFGWPPDAWDPLLLSAVAILIVGMWLGLLVTEDVPDTLSELARKRSLEGDPGALARCVAARADRLAGISGLAIAVLLLASYTSVYAAQQRLPDDLPLVALAGLGGYLGGRVIGRMIAVGQIGSIIGGDARWQIHPQLASLDDAAGLSAVGRLYLKQALVLFIHAVFLMAWWLIIPVLQAYEEWRSWYLGLLLVAMVLQLAAFVWPMWSFHRQMKRYRDDLLRQIEADGSQRLADLDRLLLSAHDAAERTRLTSEVNAAKERYTSVRTCPTWPVDRRVRRKFSIRNAFLLVPLTAKLVGLSGLWSDIAETLGRVFGEG